MTLFLDAAAATAGSGGFSMLLMIVIMFAVFYFFVIRPENKKKKKTEEMRNSLSLGDEIITIGGMIGKIVQITDDTITFETGEDVRTESASRPRSGPFPPRRRWKRKRPRRNKLSGRMKQHPCQYDLLSYRQGVFFCLNRKGKGSIYRCLPARSRRGAYVRLRCLPARRSCMPQRERIFQPWDMQAQSSVFLPQLRQGAQRA